MRLPPKHPLGRVSDPYDVMSPDPYADPSGLHDELEEQVGEIDRQLVGRAAGRRDGFDSEQRRFLTERDAPDREEATPRGGALESVALELGGFAGGFGLELDDGLDLEAFSELPSMARIGIQTSGGGFIDPSDDVGSAASPK